MNWENDTFGLVLRMRQMVYSSKDFESLWFLYQAEGLPKNISIEEFCTRHGVDYPTFETWYKKTHKKVCPVTVTGMPTNEEEEIRVEAEKVSEESKVHDPVRHPFKYPTDRVASINKKISINIKFPDGMRISKTGISFTELKHLIERLEVVC
jgi:hypothetical protein